MDKELILTSMLYNCLQANGVLQNNLKHEHGLLTDTQLAKSTPVQKYVSDAQVAEFILVLREILGRDANDVEIIAQVCGCPVVQAAHVLKHINKYT